MRKIFYMLLIGLLVIGLAACSKDGKEEDNKRNATEVTGTASPAPTKEADVTETVTPEATPEETPVPTEGGDENNVTPEASASPTEKAPEPTATGIPDVTATPTEEPVLTGNENASTPDIMTVASAYYDYVAKSMITNNYEKAERTRFGLALIDEDDIPELLIAEDNSHGTGVKVVFYNNGDPKEVGVFGENGGFSYMKKENSILDFFMAMGIRTLSKYSVNPDLTLKETINFRADDNGDEGYKINGEDVDVDSFDEQYDEAFESDNGNKTIYVEYYDLLPYHPYLTDPALIDAFAQMYNELLDPDYDCFSGYFNDNMQKLTGSWSLIRGTASVKNIGTVEFDSQNTENEVVMLSMATVDKFNGVGLWLSSYRGDESIDDMTLTSYAMPMTYFGTGISEGLDYGWSVKAEPEFGDWSYYLCMDDNDHLIIAIFREREGETDSLGNPLSDSIVLTYERDTEDYQYYSVKAELTRQADADKDGMKAFVAKEYLVVTQDDIELITKYELPEDLDGYDYEIVHPDKEAYTVFIDDDTTIEVLDFENGLSSKKITAEEFANLNAYGSYNLYFDPDDAENLEGKTVLRINEDYTG